MTPEQAAAFAIAMSVNAAAEIVGMQAANAEALRFGRTPPYSESDFNAVPVRHGITHGQLINLFEATGYRASIK